MCIHLKSVAPPIAKVLAAQQIEILIFCAGNNMIISGATDYKAKAMSSELVGRLEEQRILNSIYRSNQAEFLAIYGRRRIGKTFLIKKYFTSHKANFFSITGIQNADTATQIERFIIEIGNIFYKGNLLTQREKERLRGREIALVPQSVTFLDPLLKVGKQIEISLSVGNRYKRDDRFEAGANSNPNIASKEVESDEEKVKLSDFVIVNDGAGSLIEQVQNVIQQLKDSCK